MSQSPPGIADRRLLLVLGLSCALGLALLQLVEPFFFLRDDNATHFLPAYTYTYDTLTGTGEMPLVNHHQFLGSTYLATGQTGVFLAALYPVMALLRLLGLEARALIDVLASLHLLLGGLGMGLLLRFFGIRSRLVLPLALCWCFFPFGVLVSRSWVFVSFTIAYLPWNLWLLLRFLERPGGRRGALLVAIKSLFLLTGYVQYMVIASFFELCFLALFWLKKRDRRTPRQALAVALIFVLTGLLAAPLLLPLWQAKEASAERAERLPTARALSFALGPTDFVRTQFLLPREGALFRHGSTAIYFLGLPCLAALAFALRRRRQLAPAAWAALGAGVLTLAMSTLLYYVLYLTPLFASLRWPFKNFPVAGFFLLVAAAAGASLFTQNGSRRRWTATTALLWLNLALQLGLLLVPSFRHPFGPNRLDRPVEALRSSPLMEKIGDQGRVIAALAADDPATTNPPALRLGFLFATLAGKYHAAGYDPLLAQLNQRLSPRVNYNTELVVPPGAWETTRAHLESLSVRYVLVAEGSRLRPALAADVSARQLATEEGILLFELKNALPLVLDLDRRQGIPFRWRANGLELDLPPDFAGGRILLNVAALGGYDWWLDGEAQGEPGVFEDRLVVEVPPGAHHLELRYGSAALTGGLALATLALLLLLVLLRQDAALARWLAPPDSAAGASGGTTPDAEHGFAESEHRQGIE